jgi:hypothetical protein
MKLFTDIPTHAVLLDAIGRFVFALAVAGALLFAYLRDRKKARALITRRLDELSSGRQAHALEQLAAARDRAGR